MKESLSRRQQLFFAAASVTAHAISNNGFRQRDVRFWIELFSNWVETSLSERSLRLQNTQIGRYLTALINEGYARQASGKSAPLYRLTRIGLIELMSQMVGCTYHNRHQEFFFLYYFVSSYQSHLFELVKREGQQFPPALQIELRQLLDEKALVAREINNTEKEIAKLDQRINDALATSALMQANAKRGAALAESVREAQRKYPYELNSQKPLSELISSIPEELRCWELDTGNCRRARLVWKPAKALLGAYLAELRALA